MTSAMSAADVTASATREKRNIHLHSGEALAEALISSRRAGDGEGRGGGDGEGHQSFSPHLALSFKMSE